MKKQLPLILTAVVALFIIFANFTFYGTEKELTGKIAVSYTHLAD